MGTLAYLLNGVEGNSLKLGIYSNMDNEMLSFGAGGKYLGAGPLAYKYTRLREIDLVSLINVENEMEVAYIMNKTFQKYPVNGDIFEIVKWCNTHPDLIFVGRRDLSYLDNKGSVPYIQYFFGFNKGKMNERRLWEVMGING